MPGSNGFSQLQEDDYTATTNVKTASEPNRVYSKLPIPEIKNPDLKIESTKIIMPPIKPFTVDLLQHEDVKDDLSLNSNGADGAHFKTTAAIDSSREDLIKDINNGKIVEPFNYGLELPYWGVPDYINERNAWQKSLYSLTGEPGFFYFKIFFKFNTSIGLFGDIMFENQNLKYTRGNCASEYLTRLIKTKNGYNSSILLHRLLALTKFVGTLSFISSEAPWFFSSVSNLNQAYNAYIKDFTKEKFIEIGVTEDAVDMRLSMLFDLYINACYDNINCKEVIPENLRKFDMSIAVYGVPLKYFQTGIMAASFNSPKFGGLSMFGVSDKAIGVMNTAMDYLTAATPTYLKYKSLTPDNNGDFSNIMSFQMFSFKNCEFDVDSFGNYYSDIENKQAFSLGKNKIKIKFDRCLKHQMNEFNNVLFGTDGFYYNNNSLPNVIVEKAFKTEDISTLPNKDGDTEQLSSSQQKRLKGIRDAAGNTMYMPKMQQFKSLIDYGEFAITNCYLQDDPDRLGNVYGSFGTNSRYFSNKLKWLKAGTIMPGSTMYGLNDIATKNKIFKQGAIERGSSVYGNINHYLSNISDPQNVYFRNKIKWNKLGTIMGGSSLFPYYKQTLQQLSMEGEDPTTHGKMVYVEPGVKLNAEYVTESQTIINTDDILNINNEYKQYWSTYKSKPTGAVINPVAQYETNPYSSIYAEEKKNWFENQIDNIKNFFKW